MQYFLEGRLESCRTRCGIEPGTTVARRRALSSGGGTVRRESPQSRIYSTEAQPSFLPRRLVPEIATGPMVNVGVGSNRS